MRSLRLHLTYGRHYALYRFTFLEKLGLARTPQSFLQRCSGQERELGRRSASSLRQNGAQFMCQVSPWYTYFGASLPRMMLLAYPFFLAGVAVNPTARRLVAPLAFYVAVMSLLKHKEWRFICYVVPTFNIVSLASIVRM